MSEQYFTANPVSAANTRTHHFTIRGATYTVTTATGVFSADRLDKATQILLDNAPNPPAQGTFLDLGCGWGALTLALAASSAQAKVLAVDVNERCLKLTKINAAAAGLKNVEVWQEQALLEYLTREGIKLDLIWSNPPIRIGKAQLHLLLTNWLARLSERGQAWLVVGKNLGADSLAKWLTAQGYSVVRATTAKGFRLLQVTP